MKQETGEIVMTMNSPSLPGLEFTWRRSNVIDVTYHGTNIDMIALPFNQATTLYDAQDVFSAGIEWYLKNHTKTLASGVAAQMIHNAEEG